MTQRDTRFRTPIGAVLKQTAIRRRPDGSPDGDPRAHNLAVRKQASTQRSDIRGYEGSRKRRRMCLPFNNG